MLFQACGCLSRFEAFSRLLDYHITEDDGVDEALDVNDSFLREICPNFICKPAAVDT